MNVLTLRLPEDIEKKLKLKAQMEHRSVSEQIKKYFYISERLGEDGVAGWKPGLKKLKLLLF